MHYGTVLWRSYTGWSDDLMINAANSRFIAPKPNPNLHLGNEKETLFMFTNPLKTVNVGRVKSETWSLQRNKSLHTHTFQEDLWKGHWSSQLFSLSAVGNCSLIRCSFCTRQWCRCLGCSRWSLCRTWWEWMVGDWRSSASVETHLNLLTLTSEMRYPLLWLSH